MTRMHACMHTCTHACMYSTLSCVVQPEHASRRLVMSLLLWKGGAGVLLTATRHGMRREHPLALTALADYRDKRHALIRRPHALPTRCRLSFGCRHHGRARVDLPARQQRRGVRLSLPQRLLPEAIGRDKATRPPPSHLRRHSTSRLPFLFFLCPPGHRDPAAVSWFVSRISSS